MLDSVDGFISVERFQSLTDPKRYLSLSYWREAVFDGYRICVAAVLRDYGLHDRAQAPTDSLNYFL